MSATVTALKHRIDVDTGSHVAARTLALNEIGFCNFSTAQQIASSAGTLADLAGTLETTAATATASHRGP